MTLEDDKAAQVAAVKRRVGADSVEDTLLADLYDEALQAVMDYTGRSELQLTRSLMIAARRYAVVLYNQQGDEGEAARTEGGVARTFETGIPAGIRSAIAPYRLARTRRLS
jgi:hypothetical protein